MYNTHSYFPFKNLGKKCALYTVCKIWYIFSLEALTIFPFSMILFNFNKLYLNKIYCSHLNICFLTIQSHFSLKSLIFISEKFNLLFLQILLNFFFQYSNYIDVVPLTSTLQASKHLFIILLLLYDVFRGSS